MALRVLMLRKQRDDLNKKLKALVEKKEALEKREAEAAEAIEELTEESTEEEKAAVSEEVDAIEAEKDALEKEEADLNEEVRKIEESIAAIEEEQGEDPVPEEKPVEKEERKEKDETMRKRFFNLNEMETRDMFAREDVKAFLEETRSAIKEKRTITGAGLLVPEVFLGLLRENILDYSKLYRHVDVRAIGGNGRAVIMGSIPEAVWTDCCGNLNEMDLTFNDLEVGCWKVGGYYAICNATLEDSDIDLASEIMTALGQGIGYALDKAILFGLGTRMPMGFFTRLAQTSKPADYPDTARPWVDLHTSNILSIASGTKGAALVSAIVEAAGNAKGKYSRGEKVWVMNEKTYTALAAATVTTTADGNIVTGIFDRMPVIGGIIEVLDFVPDNMIFGGYLDLYLLAERAGNKFASSEHVRFLNDQTVMKGTARYDGAPAIAEGFVAIGINGTTPSAAGITFAPDEANSESE